MIPVLYSIILAAFMFLPKYGIKYSRMDQVKFFKDCLPQILLGPFLNTSSHIADTPYKVRSS